MTFLLTWLEGGEGAPPAAPQRALEPLPAPDPAPPLIDPFPDPAPAKDAPTRPTARRSPVIPWTPNPTRKP